jgi:hypothetical protein
MAFAPAPLGATKFTLQTGLRFLSYRNEETFRISNDLFDRFRLTQYHLVLPLRLVPGSRAGRRSGNAQA